MNASQQRPSDGLTAWAVRRFVLATGILGLAAIIAINVFGLSAGAFRSDGYSYYVYLPAWFIHGDSTLAAVADDCCGGIFPEFTGIRRWPSIQRWVDPHPIGVAIQMAPFFAVAHALTLWSNLSPDGFSLYYELVVGLAGLAALLVGLAAVLALLAPDFGPGVVLATLVTLTWGTNAFHYGVFDSTFSHAFSFALVAVLLWLTDIWWTRSSWRASFALAGVAALIVLTRHANAIFLLVVPLYGVTSMADLRANGVELWRRRSKIAALTVLVLVLVFPQMALYKAATGHWVVSGYEQLGGFTFTSPHLWGVLFSVQKGLFFWSPSLLLAVAGVFVADGAAARFRTAAIVTFLFNTWLIASWFDWQFGGSFGHRAFTDGLPLFAVFLAAFFEWVRRRPRLVPVVGCATAGMVLLSTAQMLQYWLHILPIANTTWPQYRELFLRFR